MKQTEISGTSSFTVDVPYKLIESGPKGSKPLIIYLHGYKQNLSFFRKKTEALLSLDAYHLFLQGPYPIYNEKHKRKVSEWGRAWYLYDGEQQQFIKSMEHSSVFIEQTINKVLLNLQVNKHIMLGYSMGGYLAGYFALSRPQLIDDLIVIGGRIKTEHFSDRTYDGLRVLALHGSLDTSVDASPQEKSCEALKKMGAEVSFRRVKQGHALTKEYIQEAKEWISKRYDIDRG